MAITDIIKEISSLTGQDAFDVAQAAVQQIEDARYAEFRLWASGDEVKRREAEQAKLEGAAELIKSLADAGTIAKPVEEADTIDGFTEWENPGADRTKMPMLGWKYRRLGRVWESLIDFNPFDPGDPNSFAAWRDVTDILLPAQAESGEEAVISYTDNRQYTAGSQKYSFEGETYVCSMDHFAPAGWNPVNAYAYWTKVES